MHCMHIKFTDGTEPKDDMDGVDADQSAQNRQDRTGQGGGEITTNQSGRKPCRAMPIPSHPMTWQKHSVQEPREDLHRGHTPSYLQSSVAQYNATPPNATMQCRAPAGESPEPYFFSSPESNYRSSLRTMYILKYIEILNWNKMKQRKKWKIRLAL